MAGDASYGSVSLLLDGVGANNSTAIADKSPTPKTVTCLGDAKISTAQSKFGGSSIAFDGVGDYLTVGSAPDFNHLHDDSASFCIEGWAYWAGGSGDLTILGTAAASANVGMLIQVMGSNGRKLNVQIYRGAGGSSLSATSTAGLTANAWTYFRFNYTKTTRAYEFRIGSSAAGSGTMTVGGTWPASSTANASFVLAIGRYQYSAPGGYFNGYLGPIRITTVPRSGSAEPTESFADGEYEVAGVVKDDANAVCSRVVRAYNRDTGALVKSVTSDAASGTYRINLRSTAEHNIVVLDDAGGTLYNDLIARVIPA